MFKFFKEKLKSSIAKISKKIDKEGVTEEVIEERKPAEEIPEEKKGFFSKIKEKFSKKEEKALEEEKEIIGEEKKLEEAKAEPEQEEVKEEVKEEVTLEKERIEKEKEFEAIEKEKEEAKEVVEEKPAKEELPKEIVEEIKPVEKEESKEIIEEEKPTEEIKEEPREITKEEKSVEKKEESKEEIKEEPKPKKKGFFGFIKEKIETKKISEKQFDEIFWELETALLENNVALEVIEKIKNDLKEQIVEKPIKRSKIEETIENSLKDSIKGLFEISSFDLLKKIRESEKRPFVVVFVGINGSGKTTTIAKIAKMIQSNGISCVLAAADTFRAASIEQLQKHADAVGVKLIKQDYGADPAAVAFDAISHAKSKNVDAVLIDTAGRMHSNVNLVDEMKKIIRVANPDMKIFVGESITGNDCVEQAKTFNDAIELDGIVLSKADVDEKGGAAVSVSYVTKKPILYIGIGQEYGDIEAFDSDKIIENLGLA